MRENNQIIKPGDNDGLRSTQYLQCFAKFCGLGCQMSPFTLFSQKKPRCEKVFINQLNFQTFSTVFRTSENHRSLLISSTNTEDLARVKYLLTFSLILILPGLNILWYSTWHWYWDYEAIIGLDIFWVPPMILMISVEAPWLQSWAEISLLRPLFHFSVTTFLSFL